MIIKKDPAIINSYLEDSSNVKGGYTEEVALPENTEELAAFLKSANLDKVPVTISGGGTGTAGGRIPFGGITLSLEKLNRLVDVSDSAMSITAEAGVSVEEIKAAAEGRGLFYTSHPTEKFSSVGGTIATNASGARSFKYGPTRRYVKGLRMVFANGEIVRLKRGERVITAADSRVRLNDNFELRIPMPSYKMPAVKNSAGYFAKDGMDLIDLFIGQEGTLSVITEVEMGLVRKPAHILSSFVFFRNEEDAWGFADEAKKLSRSNDHNNKAAIDALSIEYFDKFALELLRPLSSNIPADANAAIFFEQELAGIEGDRLTDMWLSIIIKHHASLDDTWVAMNEKDAQKFTGFRYAIPEALNDIIRHNGFQKLSTDIAVPDSGFMEMMRFYGQRLKGARIKYVVFGHIGENHLHVNILPESQAELAAAQDVALDFIKRAVSLGGTVSAEHGIGKIKHKYLEIMYGRRALEDMARIKKAFDPNCILGLNNIFPQELLNRI